MAGRTWYLRKASSHVPKSIPPCHSRHLFPHRSAPFGADHLRLERHAWQLERADVAELGCAHRDRRFGLLRVQPCDAVLTKRLLQLRRAAVAPIARTGNCRLRMKFAASVTRSLQAGMQAELRDIERAVATGTREAGRASRPNSAGRRRSVLIRGKFCVRRCRLVFRDCGAVRAAAWPPRPDRVAVVFSRKRASMFSSHRFFISVSIGASAGSNKMASISSAGCKKIAFMSVLIGASAGSCAHAGVEERFRSRSPARSALTWLHSLGNEHFALVRLIGSLFPGGDSVLTRCYGKIQSTRKRLVYPIDFR